jgi:hypothetical protein
MDGIQKEFFSTKMNQEMERGENDIISPSSWATAQKAT